MSGKTTRDAPPSPTVVGEVTIEEALAQAIRLHREGSVETAAKMYARILEVQPRCVDALNFLGVAESQLGRPTSGVELIGRAIAIDPGYADAHNNLGNLLKQQGRVDEAARIWARARFALRFTVPGRRGLRVWVLRKSGLHTGYPLRRSGGERPRR